MNYIERCDPVEKLLALDSESNQNIKYYDED